jgi:hypothetical protein
VGRSVEAKQAVIGWFAPCFAQVWSSPERSERWALTARRLGTRGSGVGGRCQGLKRLPSRGTLLAAVWAGSREAQVGGETGEDAIRTCTCLLMAKAWNAVGTRRKHR